MFSEISKNFFYFVKNEFFSLFDITVIDLSEMLFCLKLLWSYSLRYTRILFEMWNFQFPVWNKIGNMPEKGFFVAQNLQYYGTLFCPEKYFYRSISFFPKAYLYGSVIWNFHFTHIQKKKGVYINLFLSISLYLYTTVPF